MSTHQTSWNEEKIEYQHRCTELQIKLDDALEEVNRSKEAMKQLKELSRNY